MTKITLPPGSKILIVNIAGIGDQVMSLPALNALHTLYPESEISLLSLTRSKGLLKGIEYIKNIYELDIIYEKQFSYVTRSNIKLLFRLRKEKFAMAINLEGISSFAGKLKISLLFKLIGPRIWVGRNTFGRGRFYDVKIDEVYSQGRHTVDSMMDILVALGFEPHQAVALELPVSDEDKKLAAAFLDKKNIPTDHIIVGFNPNAYRPSRQWDIPRWIDLGNKILENPGIHILITGGRSDMDRINTILKGINNKSLVTFADISLDLLPALLQRMDLFVTNDTGPMHIAAAVGTSIVALFGPGDVRRYRPYGEHKKIKLIRADSSCTGPCYKHYCADPECMLKISVDDVYNAVKAMLPLR
ncbi:MAG: glycosyltransferase family 9 protein [bacterium]